MIKINLLPQKRAKRAVGRSPATSDASSKELVFGVVGLAAAGLMIFLFVDKPRRDKIGNLRAANEDLQAQIADKTEKLRGYESMKKAKADADLRAASINRLMAAKVVPAHILQELGEILTPNRLPTMTQEWAEKVGNGPNSDPNARFQLDWDPTHVWLSGFSDTGGVFKLEGGAQAEQDVTQLSKRLAASIYFDGVSPQGGERVTDRDRGLNYYKFTITGKVAY